MFCDGRLLKQVVCMVQDLSMHFCIGRLLEQVVCMVQDLSMHKEEIHSKLVAIMRERLATNLKQLPLIASTWAPNSPPDAHQIPPSNFAQTNAKQLRILSQVKHMFV